MLPLHKMVCAFEAAALGPINLASQRPKLRPPKGGRYITKTSDEIAFFSAINMTGKRYYLTTLGAWHRHAGRFANSHWLALGQAAPGDATGHFDPDEVTPILVLIEADEGAHLALDDDAAFEALPHPLGQKPISEAAQKGARCTWSRDGRDHVRCSRGRRARASAAAPSRILTSLPHPQSQVTEFHALHQWQVLHESGLRPCAGGCSRK